MPASKSQVSAASQSAHQDIVCHTNQETAVPNVESPVNQLTFLSGIVSHVGCILKFLVS